jgi:phosphoglycerate kinase
VKMDIATVRDINVTGRRVLLRVDFNVPIDEKKGEITDDSRIRASVPTIKYLMGEGARTVLCSHLGRPGGKVNEKERLGIVGQRLSQILGRAVPSLRDSIGPEIEEASRRLKNGEVLLLENLRFHAEEEKNDDNFARALSRVADVYVDDAFGTTHRAHASIAAIARYLPAVAGLLLEKELATLGGLLDKPVHPFASLLGGSKISDKVALLNNIMHKVDYLMIGGGMAATFLKARSYEVGLSLVETDMLGKAGELMQKAGATGTTFVFPSDVLVADETGGGAKEIRVVPIQQVPADLRIVDIGPKTVQDFQERLKNCKTIFWNGPMGIYETPRFSIGTRKMAEFLAVCGATTVVGGGSTADIVGEMGLESKMTFVSTGGGAALSFLGGEPMPGVEALLARKGLSDGLRK